MLEGSHLNVLRSVFFKIFLFYCTVMVLLPLDLADHCSYFVEIHGHRLGLGFRRMLQLIRDILDPLLNQSYLRGQSIRIESKLTFVNK